ncbi:methyltransferase domain-containing protein [uncultured Thiodictyon sp.]|uniref:methyltransferase domain-containing protein n=1 Tax=uncultured Thiodictyon sp. TaxID=1846217 RepID=UPI0025CDE1F2|nr:methyltransferase domain-containing protein [uncultured Thiodictyon sp.]
MDCTLPPCPITGRPAKRRVHGVAASVLARMWRLAGAGDVSRLLPTSGQVVLYESDTGLYFFHPRTAGDDAFYTRFYTAHRAHSLLSARPHGRVEYQYAVRHIPPGALVLDVGCGNGELGGHLPHCTYRGLDPYAGPGASPAVRRESLEQHLTLARGTYDVVTAFQVIEHVVDPRAFAAQLVELLKPGGTLILGAPLHPSPLTEIPNLLLNAPPHHLTWWNCGAFAALAAELGLTSVEITEVAYSAHEAIIFWMRRFTLVRPGRGRDERYFAHRWSWHLNLILSYLLGRMANRLFPPPASGRPCNVILVARKPDRAAVP